MLRDQVRCSMCQKVLANERSRQRHLYRCPWEKARRAKREKELATSSPQPPSGEPLNLNMPWRKIRRGLVASTPWVPGLLNKCVHGVSMDAPCHDCFRAIVPAPSASEKPTCANDPERCRHGVKLETQCVECYPPTPPSGTPEPVSRCEQCGKPWSVKTCPECIRGGPPDPPAAPVEEPHTFVQDLASAINRHSIENRSNTPDFILAEFLVTCLAAWEVTIKAREEWYGRRDVPGQPPASEPTTHCYRRSCTLGADHLGGCNDLPKSTREHPLRVMVEGQKGWTRAEQFCLFAHAQPCASCKPPAPPQVSAPDGKAR